MKAIDITGERFSNVFVISRAGSNKEGKATFLCRCDCGKEFVTLGKYLRNGHTKSCGCVQHERIARFSTKHGYARVNNKERLYKLWLRIKERCDNPNDAVYRYYGGRGIHVCKEWSEDYTAFREWALSTGYDPTAIRGACTIDRIDVDKGYEPSNCRWVGMDIQNKNKRKRVHSGKAGMI